MNSHRYFNTNRRWKKDFSVHPKIFVFFDRLTGTRRFEVNADAHGRMPVDQAVSLLVAHCLMRKQAPKDFKVMIAGGEDLFDDLTKLATKLILACPVIEASVHLTAREQEVLRGILQSLSNKEIGAKLNLSVRAVKFHVSKLLSKFDVSGRSGLIMKAADLVSNLKSSAMVNVPQLVAGMGQEIARVPEHSRERLFELNILDRRSRM